MFKFTISIFTKLICSLTVQTYYLTISNEKGAVNLWGSNGVYYSIIHKEKNKSNV